MPTVHGEQAVRPAFAAFLRLRASSDVDTYAVASLSTPSWNQSAAFIKAMRKLRDASGSAA